MRIAGFLPVDSFNVVVLAAVFVLVAIGLHFTFGLLNVVNLVHGEFILIGAYTALQIERMTGSVLLGMALAPFVAAALGVVMERGVLRFLYDRPFDSLLATFGLAVIIRQVVQLIFSPNPQTVRDPIGGSIVVLGFNIPWWRLVIVIVTGAVVIGVSQFLLRTGFGLHARATVVNPPLAETTGINTGFVRACLFAIGSAIAGPGGSNAGPDQHLEPPVRIALSGQFLFGRDYRRQGFAARSGPGGNSAGRFAGSASVRHNDDLRADHHSGDRDHRGEGAPGARVGLGGEKAAPAATVGGLRPSAV